MLRVAAQIIPAALAQRDSEEIGTKSGERRPEPLERRFLPSHIFRRGEGSGAMNFQDYEREFYFRYEEFAEIINRILEKAIETSDLPRPQSIQHRAKSAKSLKDRLEEAGKLDSKTIENHRRDLAGARIIFYTNTDVDRFTNSRLIYDNFEIERDATRIHHPTKENDELHYRAIHYTVRLKDVRANLPEYSKFKGLRCEIQIQTILNHAWSETSHDIAYKNKPREGFGNKAMEAITSRLNRIMDKYLLPAGYEFQRVQHDFERLHQGKELFDQDILNALGSAKDNNERHELLTSLKEHVLPNYDDVPGIYNELIEPLTSTVERARGIPTKPIKTSFGEIEGKAPADVAQIVVEIFDMLRYVDIERTFGVLGQIFRAETDEQVRKQILEVVQRLATYDQAVWKQAGTYVQSVLVDAIVKMKLEDQESIRPLIVAVFSAALRSEISGTTWRADSVTLNFGSLPALPEIKVIRDKAISGLFDLFKRAISDEQRRIVKSALREATRPSSQSEYSKDLLEMTIIDGIRIVDFFVDEVSEVSYEFKETIEHDYLWDYHHAREIAEDMKDKFGCVEVAKSLMASIIQLRDCINADPIYIRYKTLVGFESVFAEQWDDKGADRTKFEQFRSSQSEKFVDEITPDKENEWFTFLERCAATQSNDLATFPTFIKFLNSLARRRPDTVKRLLGRATDNILQFLPALLNGLVKSNSKETYRECIDGYIESGTHLASLVLHLRTSKPCRPDLIKTVFDKAIAAADDRAIIQCLLFAMEGTPADGVPAKDEIFRPALAFLTSQKDTRWVGEAWFSNEILPFFDMITAEEAKLLLENLLEVPQIDSPVEVILSQIARKYLSFIWDYFGQRLKVRSEREEQNRYEAFPYQFHRLENELSKDPNLAVSKVRGWYEEDPTLFRFLGGHLLSTVFPTFQAEISHEFCELVTNGSGPDADFVLAVMENYHGEPETHEVLRRIVAKYPDDQSKLARASISFDNTGGVYGEFGFVEALRRKRVAIEPWLTDPRFEVRDFAEKHMRNLDLRIADEQRRSEEEKALRTLQFGEGEGEDGLEKGN